MGFRRRYGWLTYPFLILVISLPLIMKLWTKLLLLYSLCLLRSAFIPLSFVFIRNLYGNFDYTSANCLMKLVNETSPDHFKSHLFYQNVRFDDGCDIEKYVHAQYSHGEYTIMQNYLIGLALSAVVAALADWRNVLSVKIIGTLIAGYHLAQVHHVFSHYSQDISFFAGNILHHANTTAFIDKSNASFVDTIPQGFVITIIASITWASTIRSLLSHFDITVGRFITWKSLYASVVMFGFVVGRQVQKDHPWLHEYATTDMSEALPFTWDFVAYRHVYGHHVTGEWLGPHVLLDPLFSIVIRIYAYLHNDIFQAHVQSNTHLLVAIWYDSMVSMLVVCLIWIVLRCVAAMMTFCESVWKGGATRVGREHLKTV